MNLSDLYMKGGVSPRSYPELRGLKSLGLYVVARLATRARLKKTEICLTSLAMGAGAPGR